MTAQPSNSLNTSQVSAEDKLKLHRASIQAKFITNGAVEFNLERNKELKPTLGVQLAPVIQSDGKRQGNWKLKLQMQLHCDHELIQLIHLLTRRLQLDPQQHKYGLQFKYHGANNDKMMSFVMNKDGSLSVKGMQQSKNLSIGATIQPTAVLQVLTLAYKAYASRFRITVSDAIQLIHMMPTAELPK